MEILAGLAPPAPWLDSVVAAAYDAERGAAPQPPPPQGKKQAEPSLSLQVLKALVPSEPGAAPANLTPTLIHAVTSSIPKDYPLLQKAAQLSLLHLLPRSSEQASSVSATFRSLVSDVLGPSSPVPLPDAHSLLGSYAALHCADPARTLLDAYSSLSGAAIPPPDLLPFLESLLSSHPSLTSKLALPLLNSHLLHLNATRSDPARLVRALAVASLLSSAPSRVLDGLLLAPLPPLLADLADPGCFEAYMNFTASLGMTLDEIAGETFLGDSVCKNIFERPSYLLLSAVHHIMVLLAKGEGREEGLKEAEVVMRHHHNLPVAPLLAKVLMMEGDGDGRKVAQFVALKRIAKGERVGGEWAGRGGGQ